MFSPLKHLNSYPLLPLLLRPPFNMYISLNETDYFTRLQTSASASANFIPAACIQDFATGRTPPSFPFLSCCGVGGVYTVAYGVEVELGTTGVRWEEYGWI